MLDSIKPDYKFKIVNPDIACEKSVDLKECIL